MALTRLGEDERELLEYVPSHFKVVVHVRPKMSCRQCETVIQAPAPSLPIERGRPGPNLLAHVLVAKYCDHTPLHRQSVIYGRAGVELVRSTLAERGSRCGLAVRAVRPNASACGWSCPRGATSAGRWSSRAMPCGPAGAFAACASSTTSRPTEDPLYQALSIASPAHRR